MTDKIYGIDLGTTYSAVAHINDLDQAEVIRNAEGDFTTPSVIYFEESGNVVIGKQAKQVLVTDPDNGVALIKRHMGTDYKIDFRDQTYTPEALSAMILRELVNAADTETGQQVKRVVITVPAYFGIQEREATKQAGEIAGLEVLGIVTEPVAAALSLSSRTDEEQTIFVYDLGGGTFDTTIMKADKDKVEVVAIDGNRVLGGADWDEALMDLIAQRFIEQAGLDDDPRYDPLFLSQLQRDAEDAKQSLTRRESVMVLCNHEGAKEQITVTRAEFEAATKHLIDQTIDICRRAKALAEEKEPGITIDKYLLVGGSSRMPMVAAALKEQLGLDAIPTDFDLSVAAGAAIYGQKAVDEVLSHGGEGTAADAGTSGGGDVLSIGGSVAPSGVQNALPKALGIEFSREDGSSYINFIAHKNDKIPMTADLIRAATLHDQQTGIELKIYEQAGEVETEDPSGNNELKSATLSVPALPKGSPIEIEMSVSGEGLVFATVTDPKSGNSMDVEVNVAVLSQGEVDAFKEQVGGLVFRS